MNYIALYRKYRPLKFSEVVGQEHIEKTLKNQIKNNRMGHAYLFSGGRGSGKTSTAKIFARAVNCLNPIDGEPCNECEICKAAISGSLVDITEMDAASNNGVDNIRDIREEVEFVPTSGKFRVYIIDEVHMLSTGAFNALLKTLEEPPEHVIFILATTEPQKIPATILSRCQRFDFKRIQVSDIIKRLEYICEDIGVKIEENALRLIADLADGAMRDAISILDRCVSDGDEIITEDKIRSLTGIPEFEQLYNMMESICRANTNQTINNVNSLLDSGKDVNVFCSSLLKFSRDVLISLINVDSLNYSKAQKDKIAELSSLRTKEYFAMLVTKIQEAINHLKWAEEPSIIFEVEMLKLCLYSDESSKSNVSLSSGKEADNSEQSLKDKVLTKLHENGKIRLQTDLINTSIEVQDDGIVHIVFNEILLPTSKANLQKEESKMAIKSAVKEALGRDISVKYDNLR